MSSALQQMLAVSDNPYRAVANWKERTGRKVVGCLPMNLPEELIHAAGVLPAVLWTSPDPVTEGHAHVPTYHCGFTRSFIDDMVRGQLRVLDGMVFYDTCLVSRGNHLAAMLYNPPPLLKAVHLPPGKTAANRDMALDSLGELKSTIEEFAGRKISPEALRTSINIYNEHRDLLCELYELRRKRPRVLRAAETVAAVHSSMLMPKEEHNELLRQLLVDLDRKPAANSHQAIRLVLSGHFCYPPRSDVLDLIELAGGVVVDDDLYCGARYFANRVAEVGDPLAALVDRYMQSTPPDPTKFDHEGKLTDWGDFIIATARRSDAQAVISLMVKFCPPHQEWHPWIKRTLTKAAIPELMLQVERESVNLAPIRTRLEAFIENLRGDN